MRKYSLIVDCAEYIGSHTNKELSKSGYRTLIYNNLVCRREKLQSHGTL